MACASRWLHSLDVYQQNRNYLHMQAKLAQEAMQALELGADSELALTGHTSKDVIIPKGV